MSALRPLYEHQERAIAEVRRSCGPGKKKRPMLQAPTGFGKTKTAAEITKSGRAKGKRIAFIVPRKALIDQAIADFAREGIEAVGVMQGYHPMTDHEQPVQVVSAQTLDRRKRPDVDFVIVDEAHEMHKSVLRWMADCPDILFIGLSATPWSRGLGKYWDDLIIAATTRELMDAGFLSDFVAFAPSDPDLSAVSTGADGDFKEGELADVMDVPKITGDIILEWQTRGENRPTFVFCVNRAHAQHVCERFVEAGIAAEYLDGNTPDDERRNIFARFRARETTVLVNIGVLTIGVDLDVRCIVDARPTKSPIKFVQSIGRGLRTAPGKDKLVIIDHSGNHLRLGRVTDIARDHLDDGKKREGSAKKERSEPLPKLCPECKAVLGCKARECSACGAQIVATTTVQEVEGKLVELGSRRSGEKAPDIAEKAAFFGELKGYATVRRHKPKWADYKYRERFGVWPNDPRIRGAPATPPSLKTKNWLTSRTIAFHKARERA
jgi:DNA repair protein RadD